MPSPSPFRLDPLKLLDRERDRWVLWLPVFFGLGISLYFSLRFEPPGWLGPAGAMSALLAAYAFWRRKPGRNPWLVSILVMAAIVSSGFTAAGWRTHRVAAPVLTHRTGPATVTGRVIKVEVFPNGSRVTIEDPRISGFQAGQAPAKVRLRLRGAQPEITPGDRLAVRAILSPPSPPAAPGAFDFQRQSYFRGLGGVGFSLGPAKIITGPEGGKRRGAATAATGTKKDKRPGGGRETGSVPRHQMPAATAATGTEYGLVDAITLGLARLRQSITARVKDVIEGRVGSVAAALMTGERSSIPPDLMKSLRDSGLAHLLAISGLHIGLVSAILFVGLRALLALVPALALRFPIKKWAAAFAILGAFAYALIAGATVPTQRAFLMVGLILTAVLVDRRGFSIRMVAWAALIILVLQPESLLGPSFQMSFAAVTALIAAYEAISENRRYGDHGAGPFLPWPPWARKAGYYLAGVALTTLIAGAATAPFAIYHFKRRLLH